MLVSLGKEYVEHLKIVLLKNEQQQKYIWDIYKLHWIKTIREKNTTNYQNTPYLLIVELWIISYIGE